MQAIVEHTGMYKHISTGLSTVLSLGMYSDLDDLLFGMTATVHVSMGIDGVGCSYRNARTIS